MLNKIVDLSHYDTNLSWDKIKASGIDGVYLKCTQGTGFIDPMCEIHAKNAKAEGISVGYYHFAVLTASAAQEAKFFLSRIATLPQADMFPVLDIETDTTLTPAQVVAWITEFKNTISSGMMLYSYQPYLDKYLPQGHPFGNIPLWIAQYRNEPAPVLPHGWTSAALWQYTNVGIVGGISVGVDENKVFNDSFVYYA